MRTKAQEKIVKEFVAKIKELMAQNPKVSTTELARIYHNKPNADQNETTIKNFRNRYSKYRHIIESKQEEPEPTEKSPTELIMEDMAIRRLQVEIKTLKTKYKTLLSKYEESEIRFDTLLQIKEPIQIANIEPVLSKVKYKEGIPVVLLSDWHFEETVDPQTINGLNEYNPEIAKKRWVTCIQNIIKLINKERQTSEIRQLVLWLGGDFITGYIHEELEESNAMSPTQATRFAKERIITAIQFLIQHAQLQKITVVCNFGNHGRTTKKPRVSTSYKNSYEWMMYHDIADYFSEQKNIHFIIPNGMYAYTKIFDFTCRFFHGDDIKYQGGIGGLTIPLNKAILQANKQIHADYNFMGHYHQLWQATKDCNVNGCGIGYNAYAQRIHAVPETPQQGFFMIHNKYGITNRMPIFCTQ
jgi:hypothetical protein